MVGESASASKRIRVARSSWRVLWRNFKLRFRWVVLRKRSRIPCHICGRTELEACMLVDIGQIALCDVCIGRAQSLVTTHMLEWGKLKDFAP